MDHTEEQRLRDLIRKELEAREELRGREKSVEVKLTTIDALERQRIIDDEIERYYAARGNYQRFVNEDDEVEWLTAEEVADRQRQIPVDVEELEEGQRTVRTNIVIIAVAAFIGLALMLYALRARHGSIQVVANVEGATILLNGQPTEFRTDHVLKDLTPGIHVISVVKTGYGIVGDPARSIELEAGEEEVVVFKMEETRRGGQTQN
ncbi:MAG: hypothetical protein IPH10_04275 [bacterium]|nr:hypothetical protein [bacterium]